MGGAVQHGACPIISPLSKNCTYPERIAPVSTSISRIQPGHGGGQVPESRDRVPWSGGSGRWWRSAGARQSRGSAGGQVVVEQPGQRRMTGLLAVVGGGQAGRVGAQQLVHLHWLTAERRKRGKRNSQSGR
jgi:hypothetical protein